MRWPSTGWPAGPAGRTQSVPTPACHPCPVQTRRKIRTRLSAEAIVGGVLGALVEPEALIVGRHDHHGRLRIAGRTTALTRPARRDLAAVLTPTDHDHP